MDATRWLVDHQHLLPRTGDALDVAAGRGRNALWLAARGLQTLAVDRDVEAMRDLQEAARGMRLPLRAEVIDLEAATAEVGEACCDVVVVVHYLHRPLFPALRAALRAGGLLVYETFTRGQAGRGRPTNPDYLLEPGELRDLVQPLEILVEREGDFEERMVASVIARRL